MASSFPNSIDNFTDPLATSPLNSPSHSLQHSNLNDAVEKIETYMGLVYITGGALTTSTTNFLGCFTSQYRNYRIVFDSISINTTADVYWQLMSGTTPAGSGDYSWAVTGLTETAANSSSSNAGFVVGYTGMSSNVATIASMSASVEFYAPQLAQRTFTTTAAVGYASAFYHRTGFSHHNLSNAYDGIRILTGSAATIGGNVSIYGYRKA